VGSNPTASAIEKSGNQKVSGFFLFMFAIKNTRFSAVLSIPSERTAFLFSLRFQWLSFSYSTVELRLF